MINENINDVIDDDGNGTINRNGADSAKHRVEDSNDKLRIMGNVQNNDVNDTNGVTEEKVEEETKRTDMNKKQAEDNVENSSVNSKSKSIEQDVKKQTEDEVEKDSVNDESESEKEEDINENVNPPKTIRPTVKRNIDILEYNLGVPKKKKVSTDFVNGWVYLKKTPYDIDEKRREPESNIDDRREEPESDDDTESEVEHVDEPESQVMGDIKLGSYYNNNSDDNTKEAESSKESSSSDGKSNDKPDSNVISKVDKKCHSKDNTEIEISSSTNILQSKCTPIRNPKCPKCNDDFVAECYQKNTPIMSMSCCHTICFNCAQMAVESNRQKLKRPLIKSTNCPIENCLSQNAFRYNSENWNMSLIEYMKDIHSLLQQK